MTRPLQHSFQQIAKPKDIFGGSLSLSHPKTKRPLDSKLPTHLVLRANRSVLRRPGVLHLVNAQVRRSAKRHGVRIYEYANVGNHLHLLLKLANRRSWNAFIRELTGRLAQLAGTNHRTGPRQRFWKHRPFTRIVRGWRKAYRLVKVYIRLNRIEAEEYLTARELRELTQMRARLAPG